MYAVLREADRAESSEENSEVIYKIVNFLQRCVVVFLEKGKGREGKGAMATDPLN